ncbi:MAG: hypothetical protein L6R39_006820 [Caloplaca ligustica]|nr:MAG: hypothetical protein L6R39_006820 [Caloplaca ligustica]
MVNPALWYLIDRSKPGFLLSAVVGIAGTAVLLGINPSMVPAPGASSAKAHMAHMAPLTKTSYEGFGFGDGGLISNESIADGDQSNDAEFERVFLRPTGQF